MQFKPKQTPIKHFVIFKQIQYSGKLVLYNVVKKSLYRRFEKHC